MPADLATEFVGRSLDGLRLSDRSKLTGSWIAIELYSPESLPLRVIAAVGHDARDCARALMQKGLDPARYYYEPVSPIFEH